VGPRSASGRNNRAQDLLWRHGGGAQRLAGRGRELARGRIDEHQLFFDTDLAQA